MFENSITKNKTNLLYLLFVICTFYVIAPYFLYLYQNFFLDNVLSNFPVETHDVQRKYITTILSNTNFHFLFILNLILFLLIFYFLYISLFSIKINVLKYSIFISEKKGILIMQLLVCICIFIFLKDYFKIYNHFVANGITNNHRSIMFELINNSKQTHIVLGGIFSIYLLKHKKNYIPIFFLVSIFIFEILTLSRFYIVLCCISFLILTKKKIIYIIIPITLFFIVYRLLDNESLLQFFHNFLWEPVSLWCTEIIKLKNFLIESNMNGFYSKILIDNLFVNIIFFDVSKTYNPFLNSTFQQFGIYANFGLIYTLGYPLQTLFLFILIFFLKKIIDLFSNYDDLFLIVYCFSIFKILRGSSIYGLSFILKFEILLLMIIFLSIILKKLNLFKSSS